MADEQNEVSGPRFSVGDSFWGKPAAAAEAAASAQSAEAAGAEDSGQVLGPRQAEVEAPAGEGSQPDAHEAPSYDEGYQGATGQLFRVSEALERLVPSVEDEPAESAGEKDVAGGQDGTDGQDGAGTGIAEPPQIIDADLNLYEPAAGTQEDATADPAARRRRWRRIALVALAVAALLVGYGMGVRHFSTRFLPNTNIQGHEVGGLTTDEAVASLEEQTASYACDVSVGDFELSLAGSDVSLERDEERIANEARAMQSPYAWPLRLVFPDDLAPEQGVTYDAEALRAKVYAAVEAHNEQTLPADNASVSFSEEQGTYALEGTVEGTAVDEEAVLAAAAKSLDGFLYVCAPDEASALHAATVEDLPRFAHSVEWANRVRAANIPILVNGETVITSEAWQNAQWVTIGEGPSVVVDRDAVAEWAQYAVADAVYHRDDWNDYYLDQDAFVEGLCTRLSTGVADGYEAPTYDVLRREGESRALAYERGGWDSELGRYIDVDLVAQFARLFDEKGEVLWESAFVSGNMYEAHSTVTGVFSIYAMQQGATLVGLDYNNDGKPDYESYVDYWMPFYGGYGLHDATWRYTFGGDLYYYDGSHGCINLPWKKAQELYGITFVGEVVNVHW